ncbi:hypothetical protein PULV_a3972 [Pseudoalteromonas ulvae UL12]|nr:hypothetical protein [Pseudoalteromonas ulvae UL12]
MSQPGCFQAEKPFTHQHVLYVEVGTSHLFATSAKQFVKVYEQWQPPLY